MPSEISIHIVSDGRSALAGGGGGGASSILLSTEKGQYLFNAPDPVQRYFLEKKQWKFGKLRGILFTDVNSTTAGGFTDLAMALADLDMNNGPPKTSLDDAALVPPPVTEAAGGTPAHEDPCLLLAGPSPLFAYLLTLNLVFYRPTYHIRLEELQPRSAARERLHPQRSHCSNGQGSLPPLLLEEGVVVHPILLQLQGAPGRGGTYLASPEYLSPAYNIAYKLDSTSVMPEKDVVCYAIHTPDVRGQFDVKAALSLGVPKGPLFGTLVNGQSVTTPDGNVVTPDMCIGPSQPGPVALIIRCPSLQYVEAIIANESLKAYRAAHGAKGEAQVSLVIHMAPKEVVTHPKYAEFFSKFQEVDSGENPSPGQKGQKGKKGKKKKGGEGNAVAPGGMQVFLDGSMGGSLDALPLQTSTEYQLGLHQLVPEVVAPPMEWAALDSNAAAREASAATQELSSLYGIGAGRLRIGSFEEAYFLQPVSKAGLYDDGSDGRSQSKERMHQLLPPPSSSNVPPGERPWQDPSGVDITPSVFFLGTAASSPTKYRGVSSIMVEIPEFGNMLLDCGGGTYEQLHRLLGTGGAQEALRALKCIWITHKHGDHCLGILPMLVQVARVKGLTPRGGDSCSANPGSLVCGICGHSHDYESSKMVDGIVHALVSAQDLGLPQFTDPSPELQSPPDGVGEEVQPLLVIGPMWISMWLKQHSHWVEDLDYRFVHAQDLTKAQHPLSNFFLKELGLNLVQAVLMEHSYPTFGVVMEHVCGWKLVYSADSRPSQVLAAVGRKATLLIHEATFDAPFQEKALADRHSTVEEAIAVGKWMEAEFVVLTHFSNRFESGKFPNIWSPAFLDLGGMHGRLLVAADLLRLPLDSSQLQLIATQVLPRLQALTNE